MPRNQSQNRKGLGRCLLRERARWPRPVDHRSLELETGLPSRRLRRCCPAGAGRRAHAKLLLGSTVGGCGVERAWRCGAARPRAAGPPRGQAVDYRGAVVGHKETERAGPAGARDPDGGLSLSAACSVRTHGGRPGRAATRVPARHARRRARPSVQKLQFHANGGGDDQRTDPQGCMLR
jgi:hypothetical protein